MFQVKNKNRLNYVLFSAPRGFETLEDRCLLSASHGILKSNTITFAQAPAAVQASITQLASDAGDTAPTDTTTVFLANSKGIESYTVKEAADVRFTVDQNGKVVTQAVKSSITFADITSTAVSDEFNALAAALGKNPPAPTDTVNVLTNSDGTAVYTLTLASTVTTTDHRGHSHTFTSRTTLSVDSNGDPTGNESVPLSTLNSSTQLGLTSNAPAGATALDPTTLITVKTANGVTTYSATYHATGIKSIVTVDATGTLTSLPSFSTVLFSTLPAAAQTQLQSLATADGFVGTIDPTLKVKAYDEANGTVIYSATVKVSATRHTTTFMFPVTVSSDQNGNPTVPPDGDFRGGGFFGGHDGDDDGRGGCHH